MQNLVLSVGWVTCRVEWRGDGKLVADSSAMTASEIRLVLVSCLCPWDKELGFERHWLNLLSEEGKIEATKRSVQLMNRGI